MLGFLGGWATLAHSAKPKQTTVPTFGGQAVEALPTLAPLAPINTTGAASSDSGGGLLTIIAPPATSRIQRQPIFTTSGS
jgi:hypothetical protein